MLNTILAGFYERDLRRLSEEVKLFKKEEDLWKTMGTVKNSSGNLVLHLIGGLNHYFGAILAQTGYVRNRPLEFSQKDVPRELLVAQLEELTVLIRKTLNDLPAEKMDTEFPIMFDDAKNSHTYVLTQLLVHLNYHLGQVNYLRRILE
jgi:uncharacterized protein DUF1572